jgi:hypothetical protein
VSIKFDKTKIKVQNHKKSGDNFLSRVLSSNIVDQSKQSSASSSKKLTGSSAMGETSFSKSNSEISFEQ